MARMIFLTIKTSNSIFIDEICWKCLISICRVRKTYLVVKKMVIKWKLSSISKVVYLHFQSNSRLDESLLETWNQHLQFYKNITFVWSYRFKPFSIKKLYDVIKFCFNLIQAWILPKGFQACIPKITRLSKLIVPLRGLFGLNIPFWLAIVDLDMLYPYKRSVRFNFFNEWQKADTPLIYYIIPKLRHVLLQYSSPPRLQFSD